jgi:peptide/nickel transport system substrate-binding protein
LADLSGRLIRLLGYVRSIFFFVLILSAQDNRMLDNIGDELKIGYILQKEVSLNPLMNSTDYDFDFTRFVFGDGLFRRNIKGDIEKALARDSRSIDNYWIIKIRKSALFHDDTNLTARDIKFTFDLYKKYALQAPNLFITRIIRRVEIVAPDEVRFELYHSDYDLEQSLGLLPILPEKHYKKWIDLSDIKELPTIQPVGIGHFKYTQQSSPNNIRLTVHTSHFERRAYLNALELKLYESVDRLVDAFLKGEVDYIRVNDRSVLQRIHQIIQMDAKKMDIKQAYTSLYFITLNTNHLLFSKRKIRQALSSTVNREQLVEKILARDGHIAGNMLDEDSDFYFHSINTYPYNPRKSLEILNTIGYRKNEDNKLVNDQGELKFELLIAEDSYFHEMLARLISIDMGELGINVIPVPVKPYELMERINNGRFQAAIDHFIYDPTLPDQVIRSFYNQKLKGDNRFLNFRNPQIEQLLRSSEMIFQKNQLRPIMQRIQYLLSEQAPCIYLFFEDRIFCAIDHRFENFRDIFFENGRYAKKLYPEYEWYVSKEKQKYR